MSELAQIIARILRQYEGADIDKIAMEIAEATRAVSHRAPEAGQNALRIKQLEVALVDSAHALHSTPLHQLPHGITLTEFTGNRRGVSVEISIDGQPVCVKAVVSVDPKTGRTNERAPVDTQAQAEPAADAIAAMKRAKLLPVWDSVPHSLHVELDVIFKFLNTHPQRPAVPDDVAVKRALDAVVLEGETVFWHIVFGMNNDSEEVRATIAWEIIRAALLAAAPEQQGTDND
jgi:hypothetical protein